MCPGKTPKEPCLGDSPPAPASASSQGPQRGSKVPVKKGDAPKGTVLESTKEEKGTPPRHEEPPAKTKSQRELLSARKELEKMKKDVGGGKKEPREIKKPEKTTNKSEGLKGEPGGIQEKSTDVGKEVGKVKEELGKGKEMLKEGKGIGKSTDKDQAKETLGKSTEMSKRTEKDQDKEASGESTDKDQVVCLGVICGFGALMKFSGFMQLFPFPFQFPWAGLGLAGRRPRAWMGSRGAGVWNCPCPWGKGSFVQLSFPPAPAQFPALLPAGSEGRLVRSREGLAAAAGRVHAR